MVYYYGHLYNIIDTQVVIYKTPVPVTEIKIGRIPVTRNAMQAPTDAVRITQMEIILSYAGREGGGWIHS